jgi:hypothetical protein
MLSVMPPASRGRVASPPAGPHLQQPVAALYGWRCGRRQRPHRDNLLEPPVVAAPVAELDQPGIGGPSYGP